MVPGCPDTLVESNIRAAVIELCEKAAVYQQELDPVTTVANIYEYDLEPPNGTVVHKIVWGLFEGKDLEPISSGLLEQRKPKWREATNAGVPEYFLKQGQALFWLVPVPNETKVSSVILHAQLKPTYTSTACETEVMSDHRDSIINGTLFRLLRLPSKEWSDFQGAAVYSNLFFEGVSNAERRARQGDTGVARRVKYGGIYKKSDTRKYGSGKRVF